MPKISSVTFAPQYVLSRVLIHAAEAMAEILYYAVPLLFNIIEVLIELTQRSLCKNSGITVLSFVV